MERDYLSTHWTALLRFVSVLMMIGAIVIVFNGLITGEFWSLALAPMLLVISIVNFPLCVVYFERDELVIERSSRTIRLKAQDISDVKYYGFTRLLKLSFAQETALGGSIVFQPKYSFPSSRNDPITDDGPIFEKIGQFCEWKSK